MQYDVFISHSSHDKAALARPLAEALQALGLKVWLDEEQLHVGDSIRRGIDNALRNSRFGVVILSPAYLDSEWGQKELDAFFAKEKYQNKSILPIYHGVDVTVVEQQWPLLADKISLSSSAGIEYLAERIQQSIRHTDSETSGQPVIPVRRRFIRWPGHNWQWLIGLVVAAAVGSLPFVIPTQPAPQKNQNQISGGTFNESVTQIGTQINNPSIDEDALAKRLLAGMGSIRQEDLQEKEEEIRQLKATIQRLQQQPADKLKQDALKKLQENKPAEASELLEQSLARRNKVMPEDWVDVGNLAYLTDSQKALSAYQKAIALGDENMVAWLAHIQQRLGYLGDAMEAYEHVLKLAGNNKALQAVAYGNLGIIYGTRGELDKAEALLLNSLKINEILGRQEGMPPNYGNPGIMSGIRSELDKAKAFHHRLLAQAIKEAFSRQEGIVNQPANLGIMHGIRGELDKAETFFLKSLQVNEDLGDQEGMALDYGNLGLIHGARGDLEKAEAFYLKALELNNNSGHQETEAFLYSSSGLLYLTRGDMKTACRYWQTSVAIFRKTGSAKAQQVQSLIDRYCPAEP